MLALALVLLAVPGCAQDTTTPPPTPPPVLSNEGLLHKYVWNTLGPSGWLQATLASGFDQWRDDPRAWGPDADGYAQRWTSEFAASIIGGTTKYAVARVLDEDPSFTRCECTGFKPRLRHALASPFKARKRDNRYVLSAATVVGLTAENVIPPVTWYPAPHGTRDGILNATASIFSKMGVDVFREFTGLPHH